MTKNKLSDDLSKKKISIIPNTSVTSLVQRRVNKRPGISSSQKRLRDKVMNKDDEEDDEDEEYEEECHELVFGKDSCTACPGCKTTLSRNWNVSINIVDFSYIVTCSGCGTRIVIRNLFSESQKNALQKNDYIVVEKRVR